MMQEHGGNVYRYENMLDFSANINPLGMPDAVRQAALCSALHWEQYPDPDCTALTQKVAHYEQISPDCIVCGNGAADLIYRMVHAFRPRNAVLCAPTFGEYAAALREIGCSIRTYDLAEERDFALDAGILPFLTKDTDLLILCTPNNPTGQCISPLLLAEIAARCKENGILLVCDECFLGFAEDAASYSLRQHLGADAVILKAFTKLFAMPGLRLGYAVCGSSGTAAKLRRSGQFWSVSVPAQAAGAAALDEDEYVRRTVAFIAKERAFLMQSLQSAGIRVFPSQANFLLFRACAGLDDRLRQEGILIRNCANYSGLREGYFRIAVRTREENRQLLTALGRCL